MSFSPSNNHFASAGDDGTVLMWDARQSGGGAIAALHTKDNSPIRKCCFEFGGGNFITTISDDGRVCVFDVRKLELAR